MPTFLPRRSLVLGAAVATTILAGCGGSATPAPSVGASPSPAASAPAGASPSVAASPEASSQTEPSPSAAATTGLSGETGTVEILGTAFAITLADGWRAFELDADGQEAIKDLFPADLEIGELLSSQAGSLGSAGVKLFALDGQASPEEGVATVNVVVQPRPAGLPISLLGQLAASQLEALDAFSNVEVENVTLPAGDAVKATYDLSQQLADGTTVTASARQYYVASDDSLFIVTMTGAGEASGSNPEFDAMAESITLD